jgi:hypothetical protein
MQEAGSPWKLLSSKANEHSGLIEAGGNCANNQT